MTWNHTLTNKASTRTLRAFPFLVLVVSPTPHKPHPGNYYSISSDLRVRALELHRAGWDIEHGGVKLLAFEGRSLSLPAFLQHVMHLLQRHTDRAHEYNVMRVIRNSKTHSQSCQECRWGSKTICVFSKRHEYTGCVSVWCASESFSPSHGSVVCPAASVGSRRLVYPVQHAPPHPPLPWSAPG